MPGLAQVLSLWIRAAMICQVLCKMSFWGSLFKKDEKLQDGNSITLNPMQATERLDIP